MTTDQEKVLKVLGGLKEANSQVVGIKADLGGDYADCLCQELSKGGHLDTVSEEKPRRYRLTAQGEEAALKVSEEEAARKEIKWAELKCAFCKGMGRDPFGLLSHLSHCPVCHGRGHVRVAEPYETCQPCQGTGVYFRSKMYCWTCRGKGVVTVKQAS